MKIFGTIGLIVIGFWAIAQPSPVIQLPEKVCKTESFQTLNTTTGATQFFWEFGYGGLDTAPTAFNLGVTPTTDGPDGLTIHHDAGTYIGFTVSANSSNLVRINFGNSLTNAPTHTDLGSLSGSLVRPRGLAIISYNNNWYGLVSNSNPAASTASILRIDFGNSLLNTPTVINLGTFSGRVTHPQTMQWVTDHGDLIGLIGDRVQRKVLMVNFKQDPTTASFTADAFKEITFSGSGFFRDFSIVRGADKWYGLAIFENGGIHKINFAATLFETPQTLELTAGLPVFTFPSNVAFLRDVDRFVAIVSEYGGTLKTLDFDKNPASNVPIHQSLGNPGGLNNLQGLQFIKTNTGWIGFAHNIGTSWLHRITFNSTSDASLVISSLQQPTVSYATAGMKYVSMQAMDAKGESKFVTGSVLVKMDPQADFSYSLNCTAQNTIFIDASVTQGNLTWAWQFNDPTSGSTTSTLQNPTHQFTSATNFSVELTVTDDCGNTDQVTKTVTINNAATTTLNIVAESSICSYQDKQYALSSNASPITNVLWNFGTGQTVGTPSPTFAYNQDGNFTVTVDAIVNQCIKQATQAVNVKRGAQVLFTQSSQCENTPISFNDQIVDTDIVEFEWIFPVGTSTEENPQYTFPDPGDFNVTLHVKNSLGCETSLTKNLRIYSQPQVDFTALAPPFSCSGTPTEFNDLTPPPSDSNLSSWFWNFGDTGNPSNTATVKNPQHTYANAGDYNVSLTVTSNFSCSSTLQKSVTIHPTPNASFNHSALCEDGIVTFVDAAINNQAWNWQIGSSFYTTQTVQHTFTNPGDYEVTLSVTGANNCVGTSEETVIIKPKLVVDYSVLRNCVNQQTQFTNLTNDSADPITAVNWNFGGLGSSQTNPATFSFPESGAISITLTVTTQSGCEYPITKPITIAPGPLAAFTAEPNTGEGPLPVQFVNTSMNATTYSWNFDNGSTSTTFSPAFIFETVGAYTVELIAVDANNCSDITRQLIEVTEPLALDPPTPNPSHGSFAIEWRTPEATRTMLTLVDATGRTVREYEVMSTPGINRTILNATGEQSGLYILQIRYRNTIKTYRLIISR